jgi:hypothetical protein
MISQQPTQATHIREPQRLEGWKVVIAFGTAVILAPVIALAFFLALATALPVLPFVVPLLAELWLRSPHGPPASAPGPLSVAHPISSLPSSSFKNA